MDPDFSLIQSRLSHEDDLVNQRVSWLVNSQSFLLTAYAITLNGLAADASKPLAIVQRAPSPNVVGLHVSLNSFVRSTVRSLPERPTLVIVMSPELRVPASV